MSGYVTKSDYESGLDKINYGYLKTERVEKRMFVADRIKLKTGKRERVYTCYDTDIVRREGTKIFLNFGGFYTPFTVRCMDQALQAEGLNIRVICTNTHFGYYYNGMYRPFNYNPMKQEIELPFKMKPIGREKL